MGTSFNGFVSYNSKAVSVMHNPGWGEPEEWYLTFSDGTRKTISNPEGMGKDQLDYLNRLTADKYRHEILANNWAELGNKEDVIKVVLDYLEFNETNAAETYSDLKKFHITIDHDLQDIAESMYMKMSTADDIIRDLENTKKKVLSMRDELMTLSYCLQVYEKIKKNEPVGTGWNNASLVANFGETELGKLARTYL